jgi:hypothetical protein
MFEKGTLLSFCEKLIKQRGFGERCVISVAGIAMFDFNGRSVAFYLF